MCAALPTPFARTRLAAGPSSPKSTTATFGTAPFRKRRGRRFAEPAVQSCAASSRHRWRATGSPSSARISRPITTKSARPRSAASTTISPRSTPASRRSSTSTGRSRRCWPGRTRSSPRRARFSTACGPTRACSIPTSSAPMPTACAAGNPATRRSASRRKWTPAPWSAGSIPAIRRSTKASSTGIGVVTTHSTGPTG